MARKKTPPEYGLSPFFFCVRHVKTRMFALKRLGIAYRSHYGRLPVELSKTVTVSENCRNS